MQLLHKDKKQGKATLLKIVHKDEGGPIAIVEKEDGSITDWLCSECKVIRSIKPDEAMQRIVCIVEAAIPNRDKLDAIRGVIG